MNVCPQPRTFSKRPGCSPEDAAGQASHRPPPHLTQVRSDHGGSVSGGNPFDGNYGSGKTEYEKYLQTHRLLSLQKRPEERLHEDELLFQSVHQVEEIWMKLTIHELGEAVRHFSSDEPTAATRSLGRATQALTIGESSLRLFDTMGPAAYLQIRRGLGRGSGADSPGFRRINQVAPHVWEAFDAMRTRMGADLIEAYRDPTLHPVLLASAEEMLSFDVAMVRFKQSHMAVVQRIIGVDTASLRGNASQAWLQRSAAKRYFPALWEVRATLFADFAGAGAAPRPAAPQGTTSSGPT